MIKKMLLENRKVNTADDDTLPRSWYAPREYFNRFPSVDHTELWNTTSSAGDWDGYIIQKLNGWYHLIPFNQENNYPYAGFTLYTGKVVLSWKGTYKIEEINKMYADITD
jgi:hypothetical protein